MSLTELRQAVIDGNSDLAASLTERAMKDGVPAERILDEALIGGMRQVGEFFERGEFFVPEMLVAAEAMGTAMKLLRASLVKSDYEPVGKVVLGTVEGDLHDIGKRLVGMMLEGSGFEVVDVGINVPPRKFVEAVAQSGAGFVGLSALLTTTLPAMEETIRLIRRQDAAGKVKIMVGGAPVTAPYAERIGADGYAPDAPRAATLARNLAGK